MNDETIMYFIVNKDLNMSAGKIAAQVGHAVAGYMNQYFMLLGNEKWFRDNHNEWFKDGLQKKIVLKATEKEMVKIIEQIQNYNNSHGLEPILGVTVVDAGLTEVPTGSHTCFAIYPNKKELLNNNIPYFKRLQLL